LLLVKSIFAHPTPILLKISAAIKKWILVQGPTYAFLAAPERQGGKPDQNLGGV